jgi:hypothetical protein
MATSSARRVLARRLALLSIGALTWYEGGSSTVALDAAGLGILVAAMAMMATAIRQH